MRAEDRIRNLITAGETPNVEFKSSFRFDLEQQKVNKDLTKAVAKTIAGFMNSEGGTLLIGVSDDREIVGIERDIETLTKKTLDGFELSLRTAIANLLGGDKSSAVAMLFYSIDGKYVAQVECKRHAEPVILVDGDKYEFYVRDGNLTRPLNSLEQYNYTKRHFSSELQPDRTSIIRDVVGEVLTQQREQQGLTEDKRHNWKNWVIDLFRRSVSRPSLDRPIETAELVRSNALEPESAAEVAAPKLQWPESTRLPPWLTVRTRNVLDSYLFALQRTSDWKRLNIISPWLSSLDESFSLTSTALAERMKKYGTTVYIVTRPPIEAWHSDAVDAFAATGRANIALVPELHTKLFTASTADRSFALIGSANFTQNSANNLEIGLLAHSYMDGKQVVSALDREAAEIYRTPGRKLIHRARF